MSQTNANVDDFGMDSASMAGSLEVRLTAARDAGFSQLMLSAADLTMHPLGVDAALASVHASGMRVTGFQSLRDFEGLSGQLQTYKIGIAKSVLDMCQALDCHRLVVPASTLALAATDNAALMRTLRQLAMLAIPKDIKIAYKAWSGAHTVKDFGQAWDLIWQADMPNLGLCLDAAEMLASEASQDYLDFLEPEKLFLVQLADCLDPTNAQMRVFPGEGVHSEALAALVTSLHGMGYRGDYSLAVTHDDGLLMPAAAVAQRAWNSALWLGQDVLQRSVPLPNQIRLKRTHTR